MALPAKELKKMIDRFDKKEVAMELAGMPSNRDYGDQVPSILTFLRYMGSPTSRTLYSGGTPTEQLKKDLHEIISIFAYSGHRFQQQRSGFDQN